MKPMGWIPLPSAPLVGAGPGQMLRYKYHCGHFEDYFDDDNTASIKISQDYHPNSEIIGNWPASDLIMDSSAYLHFYGST